MEKFQFETVIYGNVMDMARHGLNITELATLSAMEQLSDDGYTCDELVEEMGELFEGADDAISNLEGEDFKGAITYCLEVDEDSLCFDADETSNLDSAKQVAFSVSCRIDMEKLGERLGLEAKGQERA